MKFEKAAFCLPGQRIDRRRSSFGVYGADGLPLPMTQINTASWQTHPDPRATAPAEVTRLVGPALFAGSIDKQFGFILLNSLGRLWALETLPKQTSVVYAAKPVNSRNDHAMVAKVLRALGLENPIVIAEAPLWFEDLALAEERFGESLGGCGTPEFYDWIDRRWPAAAPPDPAAALYVTRSGLGPMAGRFASETHLETLLQAEGYEVFAPEAHAIEDQVRKFQGASRLIFAESSAMHLFSLIRRPGQISAVVQRRPELPAVMVAQMQDRAGTPTLAINAIDAVWWPPLRGEHLGRSVLNFGRLRAALAQAGLIKAKRWAEPDPEQLASSLRAGLEAGQDVMDETARSAWLAEWRKARKK